MLGADRDVGWRDALTFLEHPKWNHSPKWNMVTRTNLFIRDYNKPIWDKQREAKPIWDKQREAQAQHDTHVLGWLGEFISMLFFR